MSGLSTSDSAASILVVDDNRNNRLLLERILLRDGYEVLLAESGEMALAMLQEHDCDLVLLDAMMPEMDGFTVLSRIRQSQTMTHLPVIVATAVTDSETVVRALQLGANDYVTKPIDTPVVLARIQTHLALKRLAAQNEEFLSIATHDVKKPLALIMDISQVLLEELDTTTDDMRQECREMVSLIKRAATNMETMVCEFLDLRVLEHGKIKLYKEQLCLNDIARDVFSNDQALAERKRIRLELHLDEGLPMVNCDRARIEQVVSNFVGNAIKFSEPETNIIIRTSADTSWARLEVQDQGPGLREGEAERAFNKYARMSAKPTAGESSTGLGLAISKQFVALHRGKIGACNNPGRGACFWFQLPRKITY